MADPKNDADLPETAQQIETSDEERDTIRNANDRDQQIEREGGQSEHNRGYDEAVRGRTADVDPDSAESDVDRDDTLTD